MAVTLLSLKCTWSQCCLLLSGHHQQPCLTRKAMNKTQVLMTGWCFVSKPHSDLKVNSSSVSDISLSKYQFHGLIFTRFIAFAFFFHHLQDGLSSLFYQFVGLFYHFVGCLLFLFILFQGHSINHIINIYALVYFIFRF